MRRLGALALAAGLLAGCAPSGPAKPDEATVTRFSARGYVSGERFGVSTTLPTWTLRGDSYAMALTVPDKAGPFPLIVYLPALGESRNGGNTWRLAWAQAGYAVLSIQPFTEDERAWSSPRARTGDFAGIARQRYAADAMAARIDTLQDVLRELASRRARAETPLDRIDLSRVAVAGYDLGAYTAMTIGGEALKNIPRRELAMPVRAVIALSPYSDFSGLSFAERYRGIAVPVLSITTDNDVDPIGVVTSPSVRKAPFEYMPAGDKYLLLMWGLPHFALGGNDMTREGGEGGFQPDRPAAGGESRGQGGRNTGGRARGGGNDRGGYGEPGANQQERTAGTGETVSSATGNAIGIAAIVGVSTAFLDAYLKDDSIAREWLGRDASRWLNDKGEFKKK
jgi:hypothetical protein